MSQRMISKEVCFFLGAEMRLCVFPSSSPFCLVYRIGLKDGGRSERRVGCWHRFRLGRSCFDKVSLVGSGVESNDL